MTNPLLLLPLAVFPCLGWQEQESVASETAQVLADEPLAAYRIELLDLAFQAASALPLRPHVKSRSQAQDAVVAASLELRQPARALGYLEQIENWRRGACYADLAFYCAQNGHAASVQPYLDLARQLSDNPTEENPQSWQRDRVRVKIARTHALLGQTRLAAEFQAGVVEAESGKVDAVEATFLAPDAFEAELASLDAILAGSSFDQARNALDACAQLFHRFYDDEARRGRAESRIKTSWEGRLPSMIRIDLLMQITRSALDHGDEGKALELVNETRALLESSNVALEYRLPLQARLAALRFQAKDEGTAKRELEEALATYDAQRETIVNVFRARTLCPLAEAYQALGEPTSALALYKRTVEEGSQNPNSRPRAEDLSATCLSMALRGVEPDAHLRKRLADLCSQLGEPW